MAHQAIHRNVHQNVHRNESMADTIDEVWRIVPTLSDYATLSQAEKQQRRNEVAYGARPVPTPTLIRDKHDKATHYAGNDFFLRHLQHELLAQIIEPQQTTFSQAQPLSAAAPAFVPTWNLVHSVDPSISSEESLQATTHQATTSPQIEDAVPAPSTIDLERASPSRSSIRPTRRSSEQPSQIASRQATVENDVYTNLGNMSENQRGKMRADHPMFAQESRGTSLPTVATAASALNRSLFRTIKLQSPRIPEIILSACGPSTAVRGPVADWDSSERLYQEQLEARQDITNISAPRRLATLPTFGSRPSVMDASRALAEIPSNNPTHSRIFPTHTAPAMGTKDRSVLPRANQASASITANRASYTTATAAHTSSTERDHAHIHMESQIEGYDGPRLPTYDETTFMPQSMNPEDSSEAERRTTAREVRRRRFRFVANAVSASDHTRAAISEPCSSAEDQFSPPPTPPRSESPSSSAEDDFAPPSTPTHSESFSNETELSATPSLSNSSASAGDQSAPPPPVPNSQAWPAPPPELIAAREARARLIDALQTKLDLLAYASTPYAINEYTTADMRYIITILREARHEFRESLRNHDHTQSMRSVQNIEADIWGPLANRVTHSFIG